MSFVDHSIPIPSSTQLHRRHQSQILQPSRRSFPQLPTRARTKIRTSQKLPCYDWIFSSATNAHVAIDRSAFKTFIPFDGYVLTISGSNEVSIRGIGSVDLKIRCKPNSSQSRTITLDNVLYVPGWVCNIISDIYLATDISFDYRWTDVGLQFTRKVDGKLKPWGYTETFAGLDRLVLSRRLTGRSPMLEDKEREVWSVNLNWPQSQRDRWNAFRDRQLQKTAKEHEKEILAQQQSKQTLVNSTELLLARNQGPGLNPKLKSGSPISPSKVTVPLQNENSMMQVIARQLSATNLEPDEKKMALGEVSTNLAVKKEVGSKVGSLKATFNANRGLLKDFLAAGSKT